ncbi:response regulator [Treponema sp.]
MKKAILCVDDEAIILMSIKQELNALFADAYVYETALSLEAALSVMDELDAEGISLAAILTDWFIPGMSGTELIASYKARYPLVPCVVVTGQFDDKNIQALLQNGSLKAVLQKPWETAELRETIQLCVGDGHV